MHHVDNNYSENISNNQKSSILNKKNSKSSISIGENSVSIISYNINNLSKLNVNGISPRKEVNDKSNSSLIIKESSNNNQLKLFNNGKSNIPRLKSGKKYSVFSIFENKEDICDSPQYKEMKKFRISQRSVQKIDHQQSICETLIKEDRMKLIKNLTFFIFVKSLCISKFKGSTDFITIYRKNLLSEEHFFKSHIKNSLFEKQYKLNNCQSISFIDCFNNL